MNIVKEVCVESFSEAKNAVAGGATRIELCENLAVGGTTPSYGTIKLCKERLNVPLMVMIRPRGGDFTYSADELEVMIEDIKTCKELGVEGVVLGLLDDSLKIELERTRQLVALARPMKVTFHKAIDRVYDLLEAVSLLKEIGVDSILSSGGKETALEGASTINRMIELGSPNLKIVVAGKVTHENLQEIQNTIHSGEFHGRRLVPFDSNSK